MNPATTPVSGGSIASEDTTSKTGNSILDSDNQRSSPIKDGEYPLTAPASNESSYKGYDRTSSVSSIYRLLQRPDDSIKSSPFLQNRSLPMATTKLGSVPPPPPPPAATLVTGSENGSILVLPSLANAGTGYYRTTASSTGGNTGNNNNTSNRSEDGNSATALPVKATRLYSLPANLNTNTINVPIPTGVNPLPGIHRTLLNLPRGTSSVASGISSAQTTYLPPATLRSPQSQAEQRQTLLSGLKSPVSNCPGSFNELVTTDLQDRGNHSSITGAAATTTGKTTTTTTGAPSLAITTPVVSPRPTSQNTNTDYFRRITPPKPIMKTLQQTTQTTHSQQPAVISRRNAQELTAKSIAIKYIDRPISEYAQIVKVAEEAAAKTDPTQTSKAHIQAAEQTRERERQVYALLWLMKHCEAKHDSYVPRGRIYALYAASCSTFGLGPLSQASLGKLIRILFPDLTTRRLGMRGQSKYHYCGLRLVSADTEDEDVESSGAEIGVGSGSSVTTPDAGSPPGVSNSGVIVGSVEKRQSLEQSNEAGSYRQCKRIKLGGGVVKSCTSETGFSTTECDSRPVSTITECGYDGRTKVVGVDTSLCKCEFPFLANLLTEIFQNERILAPDYKLELPTIPRKIAISTSTQISATELDDSLTALELLYHEYRNRLFKSIISLDLDALSNTLTSFSWLEAASPETFGLLCESSEFVNWIRQCDTVTYVSSIKFLSNLVISDKLSSLSTSSPLLRLETFIQSFQDRAIKAISESQQPQQQASELRATKLQTVRTYTVLVKKLLKLAKFITNFLNSFATFKDGMRKDWETIVNLDDILEMVITTARYRDIMPVIKDFMKLNIESLLQIDKATTTTTTTQRKLEDEERKITPEGVATSENERQKDIASFNSTVAKLLQYISSPLVREWPAYIFIDGYVRFANAMVGDISLKSSENLLPWLFYNNVTTQLITYSFEVTKFVT